MINLEFRFSISVSASYGVQRGLLHLPIVLCKRISLTSKLCILLTIVGVFCRRFSTFRTFSTDPCRGISAILFRLLLMLVLFVELLLPPKNALLSKSAEPKFFRSCTSPWLQLRPTFLGGVGCKGGLSLALLILVFVSAELSALKLGTLAWKLFTERAGLDALEPQFEVLIKSGKSELFRPLFCCGGNIVVFNDDEDDDDDVEFVSVLWFPLFCSSSMMVSGMCPANRSSVIRWRLLWLAVGDISFTADCSFNDWWWLLLSCCWSRVFAVVVAGDILLLWLENKKVY